MLWSLKWCVGCDLMRKARGSNNDGTSKHPLLGSAAEQVEMPRRPTLLEGGDVRHSWMKGREGNLKTRSGADCRVGDIATGLPLRLLPWDAIDCIREENMASTWT